MVNRKTVGIKTVSTMGTKSSTKNMRLLLIMLFKSFVIIAVISCFIFSSISAQALSAWFLLLRFLCVQALFLSMQLLFVRFLHLHAFAAFCGKGKINILKGRQFGRDMVNVSAIFHNPPHKGRDFLLR